MQTLNNHINRKLLKEYKSLFPEDYIYTHMKLLLFQIEGFHVRTMQVNQYKPKIIKFYSSLRYENYYIDNSNDLYIYDRKNKNIFNSTYSQYSNK